MKVTFQTEDKFEINQLTKAGDMALALWKINQLYYSVDDSVYSNSQMKAIKEYHNEINNILEYRGINLSELTE
jgi:hypothetical protein